MMIIMLTFILTNLIVLYTGVFVFHLSDIMHMYPEISLPGNQRRPNSVLLEHDYTSDMEWWYFHNVHPF